MHSSLRATLSRWHNEVLAPTGAPTLDVHTPDGQQWPLGQGPPSDTRVALDVPAYELFRGLTGRRSMAQAASWDWSADPAPIVSLGLPYPFAWREAPLDDRRPNVQVKR